MQVVMGSPQRLWDCHMAMENQLFTSAKIPQKEGACDTLTPNRGALGVHQLKGLRYALSQPVQKILGLSKGHTDFPSHSFCSGGCKEETCWGLSWQARIAQPCSGR